eukprot:COSAG04_NODE_1026_length_8694_cov_2.500407_7_plen_338_part_00
MEGDAPLVGKQLRDFVVEGRTGRRRQEPGYYGCNSSVFNVHPRDQPDVLLAMKVVFNVEQVQTVNIEEHFEQDFALTENLARLPPHPGVLRVQGHFSDCASKETLGPSWDVDAEFVRERSLFVLMERMDGHLAQLVSDRAAARGGRPPFFSDDEFFSIATQLSSAVAHLWAHGIVHRDLKPDNMLYRTKREASGGGGGRREAERREGGAVVGAEEQDLAGVLEVKVADFGEALDAYEFCDPTIPPSFKMPFPIPSSRGGAAYFLPPEVLRVSRPGRGKVLDYTKSDAWSLGLVLYGLLSWEEPFTVEDHRSWSAENYRYAAAHPSALPFFGCTRANV